MKVICCAVVLVGLFSSSMIAQDRNNNHFEIGGGYVPVFLSREDDGYVLPCKAGVYFEWRHDICSFFDVGAKLDYKLCPSGRRDSYEGNKYMGLQVFSVLLTYVDLNIRPFSNCAFFVGAGVGPALILNNWAGVSGSSLREETTTHLGMESPRIMFVVVPRVGFEMCNHLRISSSVDISFVDNNNPLCFSVGWTF